MPPKTPPEGPKKPTSPPHLTVVSDTVKAPRRTKGPAPVKDAPQSQSGQVAIRHPNKPCSAAVALGAAMGMTKQQIAARAGISVNTIDDHYREEWETGADQINMAIVANIVTTAKSPTHPKAMTAAIYWTKARMGWRDGTGSARPGDPADEDGVMEFTLNIGDKGAGRGNA